MSTESNDRREIDNAIRAVLRGITGNQSVAAEEVGLATARIAELPALEVLHGIARLDEAGLIRLKVH